MDALARSLVHPQSRFAGGFEEFSEDVDAAIDELQDAIEEVKGLAEDGREVTFEERAEIANELDGALEFVIESLTKVGAQAETLEKLAKKADR